LLPCDNLLSDYGEEMSGEQLEGQLSHSEYVSCGSKLYAPLLQLVASTHKMENFCLGVEDVLRRTGVESICHVNQLSTSLTPENEFQHIFLSKITGFKLGSEIVGDLTMSKPRYILGGKIFDVSQEKCGCVEIQRGSYLLVPAPGSTNGVSWIEIHALEAADNTHYSNDFIESLQWALLLYVERNLWPEQRPPESTQNAPKYLPQLNHKDLTNRQNQIVMLVLQDSSNCEIANQLHISQSLVKMDLGKVFKILGITNRKELHDTPFFNDWEERLPRDSVLS
jgi:DNA-binding CsgD family transcriptional regulator